MSLCCHCSPQATKRTSFQLSHTVYNNTIDYGCLTNRYTVYIVHLLNLFILYRSRSTCFILATKTTRSKYCIKNKPHPPTPSSPEPQLVVTPSWSLSCFHGANWNNDDQDHSAGGGCYQRSDLTRLRPPELGFFPLEQRVVAWGVDVLHPVLQVVGV